MNSKEEEQLKRKLKLQVLDFPEWKKDSTCYLFSIRPSGLHPNSNPKWIIDSWYKVDYNNPTEVSQCANAIKLRARFNMGFVYGVWLPNELAEDINKDDNPEDYFDLIMKYKFEIK